MSELLRSPELRPWHLDRQAVVYVRQSTPQQVTDHKESTARQDALADRAVALGWTLIASSPSTTTWARAAGWSRAGPGSSGCSPRSPSTGSA